MEILQKIMEKSWNSHGNSISNLSGHPDSGSKC